MLKRIVIAGAVVAALAGGGTVGLAEGQPGRGAIDRRGGPRGADFGLRGLELSDAQREQVRSIHEAHRAETEAVRQKMREAHRAFAEATSAATVDESAVRSRANAIATAMADEALLRAKIRAQVHGILTAEQLQQLNDRRAAAEKRMRERQQQQQQRRRPQ